MSTSISKTSTESRIRRVVVKRQTRDGAGRIRSSRVLKDARAAGERLHFPTVYTQNVQCPSGFFHSGAKLSARLDGSAFHRIRKLVLRIDTGYEAGEMCAPFLWIDRIEVRASNGSNFLGTIFGDMIPWFWQSEYENRAFDVDIAKAANPGPSNPFGNFTVASAGSRVIYLPLTATMLQDAWMNSPNQSDIILDIFPRPPYVDGTAAQVTVNNLSFVIMSDKVTSQDAAATAALHKSVIIEQSFLEPIRVLYNNRTVAANQQLRLELDVVQGRIACLVVFLRPASGNGAHASFHTFSSGQVDLRTPGGESIYGSGTMVDEDFLREIVQPSFFNNALSQHVPHLLMSFTDDPRAAAAFGYKAGGSMRFSADKTHLSIVPGADHPTGQFDITVYALKYRSIFERDGKRSTEG